MSVYLLRPSLSFVVLVFLFVFALSFGLPRAYAQESDFNFSDLSGNSNLDLKSLLSSFKPVNGTYNNADYGFEIVFPEGWIGSEFSAPFAKIASVSSSEQSPNMVDFSAMSVMFIDNRNNTALSTITNLSKPMGAATPQSSDGAEETRCKSLSFSPVTINGIKGEEGTYICENVPLGLGSNASAKTTGITFPTNDDSLIFVSFTASPNHYDKDLPNFVQSVKTIKLSSPGDLSSSPTYKEYKKVLSQQAGN